MGVFSIALALAANSPATPTDGTVVAASLFKNGYAVIVRQADLTNGEALVRPPEGPVLGTLWISGSDGVELESARVEDIATTSQRDAGNLDDLLKANFENNVVLETTQGNPQQTTSVKGRIIANEGQYVVLEGEG